MNNRAAGSSAGVSLFLATACYGGVVHARYAAGLLALLSACAQRDIAVHLDLTGGEALSARGRAASMAKFMQSEASHLLFLEADSAVGPDTVFRLLDLNVAVCGEARPSSGDLREPLVNRLAAAQTQVKQGFRTVADLVATAMMIQRSACERLAAGYPERRAKFADMPSAGIAEGAMVFDPMIDLATRRYLTDQQAFCHRWRGLGGDIWAGVDD